MSDDSPRLPSSRKGFNQFSSQFRNNEFHPRIAFPTDPWTTTLCANIGFNPEPGRTETSDTSLNDVKNQILEQPVDWLLFENLEFLQFLNTPYGEIISFLDPIPPHAIGSGYELEPPNPQSSALIQANSSLPIKLSLTTDEQNEVSSELKFILPLQN